MILFLVENSFSSVHSNIRFLIIFNIRSFLNVCIYPCSISGKISNREPTKMCIYLCSNLFTNTKMPYDAATLTFAVTEKGKRCFVYEEYIYVIGCSNCMQQCSCNNIGGRYTAYTGYEKFVTIDVEKTVIERTAISDTATIGRYYCTE